MSYYLIGIGGTGARCLEAFVHMTGAGLLNTKQDVKIVYVDADTSCGNLTKTQETVNLYQKVLNLNFGEGGIFKNSIIPAGFWCPVDDRKNTMDDVFEDTLLMNRKETKPLGILYESLFTEQERTTNLDKGFRGHPAIGAAIVHEQLDVKKEPWKTLVQQILTDKEAKIFLFASVFGGTGAAGFPTIARLLKKEIDANNSNTNNVVFGGALVLPYFRFPVSSQNDQKEMQAKVEEFLINTKTALRYYNNEKLLDDVFSSIYMVGDNELSDVKVFSLGAKEQKNESNIIELYAALAAFDFFNKDKYTDTGVVPMIAHNDADSISWKDLPDVCHDQTFKDKMAVYIRSLYAYRWYVLESLEKIAADETYEKQVAWYKDLVKKDGGIDVHNDKASMEEFESLGRYAERFFAWMNDIINSSHRNIELVNSKVCGPCEYDSDGKKKGIFGFFKKESQRFFSLDLSQVVLPASQKNNKLRGRDVWQELCNYKVKPSDSDMNGSAFLMTAIQDICR